MATALDTPLTRLLDRQGRRRWWMAKQLGVKPWTFSKVEAGVIPIPDGWYERAAAILGVSVEEITPEQPIAA